MNTKRDVRRLAALALVAVIGAGCGDDGSAGDGDAGTAGAAATQDRSEPGAREKGVKFAECVRRNGVADFPDPDASGEFRYGVSVTRDVWMQAVEACKDLQPAGALSADRTPEEQDAGLRFARCIRRNGVEDFPDPVDGEPLVNTYRIPSSGEPGGMDILNAAMATCGDLLDAAAEEGP